MFGYMCKHVSDATRRNLDGKSIVMLLIGYHYTCAYKLYFKITNKVVFSRDVIVNELETWDWSNSEPTSGVEGISEEVSKGDSEGDFTSEKDYAFVGDHEFEGESDSEGDH